MHVFVVSSAAWEHAVPALPPDPCQTYTTAQSSNAVLSPPWSHPASGHTRDTHAQPDPGSSEVLCVLLASGALQASLHGWVIKAGGALVG
jgi:hypothetical protein